MSESVWMEDSIKTKKVLKPKLKSGLILCESSWKTKEDWEDADESDTLERHVWRVCDWNATRVVVDDVDVKVVSRVRVSSLVTTWVVITVVKVVIVRLFLNPDARHLNNVFSKYERVVARSQPGSRSAPVVLRIHKSVVVTIRRFDYNDVITGRTILVFEAVVWRWNEFSWVLTS